MNIGGYTDSTLTITCTEKEGHLKPFYANYSITGNKEALPDAITDCMDRDGDFAFLVLQGVLGYFRDKGIPFTIGTVTGEPLN